MMDRDTDQKMFARLARLQRHWRWILGGACCCGLAAFVLSLFSPKIYRATTYILVSESKIGNGLGDTAWQQMAMLPTFIPFVDNDALIGQTLKKFHLDRPPYNLTPDRFRRQGYLDVRVPKSARLLEVEVEFPSAQMAANLANDIAQSAASFNDNMNVADTQTTELFLKKQLDMANQRMTSAVSRRLKLQKSAKFEEREKELNLLLREKDELSVSLQGMRTNLAQDESKVKAFQQALVHEPPIFRLKKSVTSDRFLEKQADKLNPDDPSVSMTEESVNNVRQAIQEELINVTAKSAGESAGINATLARLSQINGQIALQLEHVTSLRSQLEAADHEYELASDAVKNASHEYQSASVSVTSKSQDLKQVAPALPPERPVRPRILLNSLLGFLLGCMLLGAIAAAIESWREMAQQSSLPAERENRVAVMNR